MPYTIAFTILIGLTFSGIAGIRNIPEIKLFPELVRPRSSIAVNLHWPGGNVEALESRVVSLLEAGFSRCEDSGSIFSLTRDQTAFILVFPEKGSDIDQLYEQMIRTLRGLIPFLPEGMPYPVVDLNDSGPALLRIPVLERVWYAFPDSSKSKIVAAVNLAALQNRLKAQWKKPEQKGQWRMVYDPLKLQDLDISPHEILNHLIDYYGQGKEFQVFDGNYFVDLLFGSREINRSTFSEIELHSDRLGKTMLKDLVEIYPIRENASSTVRVNGNPGFSAKFIATAENNTWWSAAALSVALTRSLPESISYFDLHNAATVLGATIFPVLVFVGSLLILLFLTIVRYHDSVWIGFLFFWFVFSQFGTLLWGISWLSLELDGALLDLVILLQTLNLVPLFLQVIESRAALLKKCHLLYLSAFFSLACAGIFFQDFLAAGIYPLILLQTLITAVHLWIAAPIFSTLLPISQKEAKTGDWGLPKGIRWRKIRLEKVLWILFLSPGLLGGIKYAQSSDREKDQQQQKIVSGLVALLSGRQYLIVPELTAGNAPNALRISLKAKPSISPAIFEQWLLGQEEKILKKLDPSENLVLSFLSKGSAALNILNNNGFGDKRLQEWLGWMQHLRASLGDIDIQVQFDDPHSNELSPYKSSKYKFKITGFDLVILNNWSNTLIKKLRQNPRISYAGIVDPEKQLLGNSNLRINPENMAEQELQEFRRSLYFYSNTPLYHPGLGISLYPKKLLPFDKNFSDPLPPDPLPVIIRSDQQYLQEVEFDFMGSQQLAQSLVENNLAWMKAALPPGFSISLSQSGPGFDPAENKNSFPLFLVGLAIVLFALPKSLQGLISLGSTLLGISGFLLGWMLINPFNVNGTGTYGLSLILIWMVYIILVRLNGLCDKTYSHLLLAWAGAATFYILSIVSRGSGSISGWIFLTGVVTMGLFLWEKLKLVFRPVPKFSKMGFR